MNSYGRLVVKTIETVFVESATYNEKEIAALLTLMAYKDLSYEIFGTCDDEKIIEKYSALWLFEDDRFSYHYSYIAKVDNNPVGLMTCYSPGLTKELIYPTIRHMVKTCGIRIIWHIITNLNYFYRFAKTKEAEPDEFYIGTLAVLPEYRGNGIGVKLLDYARTLAKEQGFNKCSLLVEGVYEDGIRFYERNGFKKVFHSTKPREYYKVLNCF